MESNFINISRQVSVVSCFMYFQSIFCWAEFFTILTVISRGLDMLGLYMLPTSGLVLGLPATGEALPAFSSPQHVLLYLTVKILCRKNTLQTSDWAQYNLNK